MFCRSDWSHQGTLFFLNTNRLGAGHSHEDQGSFCLASHGAVLVSDSGVHEFKSQRHNVILIDGLGQGPGQGRTEAYIRYVDVWDAVDSLREVMATGSWRRPEYRTRSKVT